MFKDYYQILGVSKQSTKDEIQKQYRLLSIKHHPSKNKENQKICQQIFKDISEAFDVLSDDRKKSMYDNFPYTYFINGFQLSHDIFIPGYIFQENPQVIFDNFCKTNQYQNEPTEIKDEYNLLDLKQAKIELPKPQDIFIDQQISLFDIYTGKELIFNYEKRKITKDLRSTEKVKAQKKFYLPKGFDISKQIMFKGEGNEHQNFEPSDLLVNFYLEEKESKWILLGKNLLYNYIINLKEALLGRNFQIEHIDGRKIIIPVIGVISPQLVIKIAGEGMPIENREERGDLFVKFRILFPMFLNFEQKEIIKEILK